MYNFDHICKETSRNVVSRFSPFWATDFLSYMQMFLLDSFLPPSSLLLPTRCDNIWLGDCHLFFSNAKTMLLTTACMLDFGKPKKVPFLLIIGSAMSITCLDKAKLFPEATFLLYLKSKRTKGYSAIMTSTTAVAPKFSHTHVHIS